jgi:hypothetical protein
VDHHINPTFGIKFFETGENSGMPPELIPSHEYRLHREDKGKK